MQKVRNYVIMIIVLFSLLGITIPAVSQDYGFFNSPESFFGFESSIEIGFFGFFYHKIQFSSSGTYFDYVKDGGQDVWFPFRRLSGDVLLGSRHRLIFLIQPIDIRTEVLVPSTGLSVDGANFDVDKPIELRYGFDFYRLSYLYDFFKDPKNELAVGASLQIRDAVITFSGEEGGIDQLRDERDIGPVPALKFRVKYYLNDYLWLGTEIDGIYAAGRGVTGSTEVSTDFVGAILDASLRTGFTPRPPVDVFLNLRYLGGGAEGTDTDDPGPGDGYVKNWLHAFSVSLGVTVR
ncbi:MAG: hypothetical protein JSV89_06495 [Spirochaetaceae bacterium]|nr:MAG: hypothetical protein JSV89_06495 [Spirochaetaceae bacterium]